MKKMIKKAICVLLVLSMCIGLTACSGSGSKTSKDTTDTTKTENASGTSEEKKTETSTDAKDHKTFKIAVMEVQLNDESTIRAKYFKDYIGPKYNCEFMFSEACTTLDAAMTFIENAADAGCDAVINYYAVPANTDQLIQLCQEYGMYYVENTGRTPDNEAAYAAKYPNFGGGFQADQPDTGRLFKEYLLANMDSSKTHNFIVGTGAAYQGNTQQTEISTNMLEAIAEMYDLKYDNTIEELITSSSPVNATNDKGIDIYCYPGAANQNGWLEGLSAALQTGKYDYLLMSPNVIGNVCTVISEVEEALNMDITYIGFGTFGDALKTAFDTTDKFGNTTLSMSTVKFTSLVSAMAFSEAYNLLTGHQEAVLSENGEPNVLLFRMQAVTSPEQLAEMSNWDTDGKWVADYDFVDSILAVNNEGLTSKDIQERIYGVTYDSIKARLGN